MVAASDATRRGAIAALALGGGALLAGCGGLSEQGLALEPYLADAAVLAELLSVERMVVAVYTASLTTLTGDDAALAHRILAHERRHVALLERLVTAFGGHVTNATAQAPPPASDRHGTLRLLQGAENTAISAYIDTLEKLSLSSVRGYTVSIMTNEAQHLALLNSALGGPAIPHALVEGIA